MTGAAKREQAATSLALYGHPFSSYTQKALIALYENRIPFDFRCLGPDAPQYGAQWAQRWPLRMAVEEARPYRTLFPLGAPDRD